MWNIDIETRIRDLNAEAERRHDGLLNTMTETDGSANSGWLRISRMLERVKHALGSRSRAPYPSVSRPTSAATSK